jgi:BCD family chlorophyll transporter-like MFS transporter
MPPNESALIAGAQHGGALAGMILVGTVATIWGRSRLSALRLWIVIGCVGSAIAVTGLVVASRWGIGFPLRETVFGLGFANGIYAVAAIGSMFTLSESAGRAGEGIRMGLFGAAQGVAFGIGGLGGSSLSDFARLLFGSPELAYGSVFSVEAALFLISALLALSIGRVASPSLSAPDLTLATDSRRS